MNSETTILAIMVSTSQSSFIEFAALLSLLQLRAEATDTACGGSEHRSIEILGNHLHSKELKK